MSAIIDVPAPEVAVEIPKLYELVNGQMEEKATAGARHGGVGGRLFIPLGAFIYARRLGGIYSEATMFTIGSNDRMPDISFVAAARMPPDGEPEGKWDIAPDLAVEIVSPMDEIEAATATNTLLPESVRSGKFRPNSAPSPFIMRRPKLPFSPKPIP